MSAHHFKNALQNAYVPNEQWKDIPFKTEDDRVSRFIDYLAMYPEHQSQLFQDWQEYYFGSKPILRDETI